MFRRLTDIIAPSAPIVLCLLALWGMEATRVRGSTPVEDVARPVEDTRLVVFWIDSLAARDVEESNRLPHIRARLDTAVHGPVRACADAVSVPCFTAMTTGSDHFSLFSLARNFAGADGVPKNSVFHTLQRRGLRIGYLGDPIFTRSVFGFDWKVIEHEMDDVGYVHRGMRALDEQDLDIVIIHIREPDKMSHTAGPDSDAYREALARADVAIDRAMDQLRPTDHAVVLGDHGHDAQGRHFAGLDVPTYAAYWGPAFDRPLRTPMAITDHASLWGRVFGIRFGEVDWVDDYFAARRVEPRTALPVIPAGAPLPWMSALALLVLVLPISMTQGTVRRLPRESVLRWIGAVVVIGLFVAAGFFWTDLRPLLNWRPKWFNVLLPFSVAVAALPFLRPWLASSSELRPSRDRDLVSLWAVGGVLLSLPTVYKYGGAAAGIGVLAVLGAVVAIRRLLEGDRKGALCLAVAVTAALTIIDPAVRNFAVRWFPIYTELFGEWTLPVAVVAVGLSIWMARGEPRGRLGWLVGGAIGLAVAATVPTLPPRLLIAPCALAVPAILVAHRRRWSSGAALALALPAFVFFFGVRPGVLGPAAAVILAWTTWFGAHARKSLLATSVAVVVLLWASLWVTIGCRAAGLDFQYFFEWLPPGADVKDTWAVNALLTLCKYLTLPLLGLLFARRVDSRLYGEALPTVWALGRLRTGLLVLFVLAFSVRGSSAGPFVTVDVLQEVLVWLVILVAVALAGHAPSVTDPADAESRVPPAGSGAHELP